MTVILAHEVGGPPLPFPFSFALIGTVWLLMLTFVVLAVAWKQPRFDPAKPGRPLPERLVRLIDSPVVRAIVMSTALMFTLWVCVAAVFGPQDGQSPVRGVAFVLLWMGLMPASLLFGPIWRAVSPARTVGLLLEGVRAPSAFPAALGYWPAAVGLFTFVWLQLASPNLGTLTAIRMWFVGYFVVLIAGALAYGQRWFDRADPFEVYSVVASRLSPFRRSPATGGPVVGNPLDNLLSLPVRPGTMAVLAVLLGALVFDSVMALEWSVNRVYDVAERFPLSVQPVIGSLVRTVGLLAVIAVVALSFRAAARVGGGDREQRRILPGQLAHVLVPVIVGVALAHTFTYFVEQAQQTLIFLADPLDRGWTFLGLNHTNVNRWLSGHPDVQATVDLLLVVAGHVVALVAAHDRLLRVAAKRRRTAAQLAIALTLSGYAFVVLYLGFGV